MAFRLDAFAGNSTTEPKENTSTADRPGAGDSLSPIPLGQSPRPEQPFADQYFADSLAMLTSAEELFRDLFTTAERPPVPAIDQPAGDNPGRSVMPPDEDHSGTANPGAGIPATESGQPAIPPNGEVLPHNQGLLEAMTAGLPPATRPPLTRGAVRRQLAGPYRPARQQLPVPSSPAPGITPPSLVNPPPASPSPPSGTGACGGPIYSNDFEGTGGTEWSSTQTSTTPVGGRRFLGEFGNTTVSLTLTNLPAHVGLTLSLDLFVIRS